MSFLVAPHLHSEIWVGWLLDIPIVRSAKDVTDSLIHKIDGYNLSSNKIVQLIPELLSNIVGIIPGLGASAPFVREGA